MQNKTPITTTLHPQGYSRHRPTADLLGIHFHTLHRWVKRGDFVQPKRINGILLYSNSDILAWLDEQHASNDSVAEV